MWDFLNSLLKAILEFIYWLVFVKLTNWEKNRLRQMGFESQEELDELMRQRYKDEIGDFSPEQEAELIRRYPKVSQVSRPSEGMIR